MTTTLHTFGCSITQGFALPDVVRPLLNDQGRPLTHQEIDALGDKFKWEDVHLYQPSQYAWPQLLGDEMNMRVINHARRGACFQQIARQCTVGAKHIEPQDTVIVMWTYLNRLSMQWPARTSVPYGSLADPNFGWRTAVVGFNKLFGLSSSDRADSDTEEIIHKYIHNSTKHTYLDPMGVYNRYYNNLVLQQVTDGFLRATGARVIHLSVEPDSSLMYLELARQELPHSLREPWTIAHPDDWYTLAVDHHSCYALLDPSIPPAENDTHPSVTHHLNFAADIYSKYFLD